MQGKKNTVVSVADKIDGLKKKVFIGTVESRRDNWTCFHCEVKLRSLSSCQHIQCHNTAFDCGTFNRQQPGASADTS